MAGESYRRDEAEQLLRPDEILQMFGRAGRRGLDETGFVLVTANELRLRDAHAGHLARSNAVDWSALLGLMAAAAEQGRDPFAAAVRAQERLFTTKPIFLGVEESLKHPQVPCGLRTDSERARHVRKRVREMLNSRGEWETCPPLVEKPLREIVILTALTPALSPRRGRIIRRLRQIQTTEIAAQPWQPETARCFPLSPGERVRVRASVLPDHNFVPSFPNPPPSKKSAPVRLWFCPKMEEKKSTAAPSPWPTT